MRYPASCARHENSMSSPMSVSSSNPPSSRKTSAYQPAASALLLQPLGDLGAAVGRAVARHHHLERSVVVLPLERLEELRQRRGRVEDRDDDADDPRGSVGECGSLDGHPRIIAYGTAW